MNASSRTLEHVGEWKVELTGSSAEAVFAELARVIADAAGPTVPGADGSWERIELEARDAAALLVDWANELIGRGEVNGRAYANVRNLDVASPAGAPPRLTAEVQGSAVDEWVSPVKAATYHGASLERVGSEWRGTILLDV